MDSTVRHRRRPQLPPEVRLVFLLRAVLYGTCTGLYTTGTAVFFIKYAGLSARQVGVGVSVGFAVSALLRVPTGRLVNRWGSVPSWLVGTAGAGAFFGCYLLVHSVSEYVALTVLISVFEGVILSAATTYFGEIFPDGARARGNAYLRSVANAGMAVGTVIAGLLTAINTRTSYAAIVWTYVGVMALDFVFIATAMRRAVGGAGSRPPRHGGLKRGTPALRDRKFLAITALSALLTLNGPLFTTVLPLWILSETDAPKLMIAVVMALNMLMVILLQVRAARDAETIPGAIRTQKRAGLALAAACLALAVTGHVSGTAVLVVLVVAAVLVTACELLSSAASWGVSYKLAPAEQRGEYLAVFSLGGQLAWAAGPALMTALVLSFRTAGWVVLAGVFLASLAVFGPVTRWASEAHLAASEAEAIQAASAAHRTP